MTSAPKGPVHAAAAPLADVPVAYVSNSFNGYSTSGSSNGDDPYPYFSDGFVSQTFFAGTSRRVQSIKEVVVALMLVFAIFLLGFVVTGTLDGRVESWRAVEERSSAID